MQKPEKSPAVKTAEEVLTSLQIKSEDITKQAKRLSKSIDAMANTIVDFVAQYAALMTEKHEGKKRTIGRSYPEKVTQFLREITKDMSEDFARQVEHD